MTQTLSEIRSRIHRKSENYFTFAYGRREPSRWRMFYGATDALLDASMAATAFGRAVKSDPAIDLLVCYGFLQAIYIQQDAVRTLSRAVGLRWHPNDDPRIKEIREIRNRLTGHPALAGETAKPRRLSSAVISYHDVGTKGFQGFIYFDDGSEQAQVDVPLVLRDNEERLVAQMLKIEAKMDDQERQFRSEHARSPLSNHLGTGFDYLIQRLHCDLDDESRVIQAKTHAGMIREKMNGLKNDLGLRGFESEATSYHLGIIFTGLKLLEELLDHRNLSSDEQEKFDLIFDGFEKNMNELSEIIDQIDAKLNLPISQIDEAKSVK
jgi:hypothetical protein